MITNTTITKMTAVEFTREYFKKHSNVELLEKGLVGTDYWYEVMEAYAKHENSWANYQINIRDKQIAELKAENNKLKSILNSPSKGDY